MFCLSRASTVASGQNPGVSRIVSNIDGIAVDAAGSHIKGGASQQGRPEPITVHIYANDGGSDAAKGIFALVGRADLGDEPAVDAACEDTQVHKHRFDIPLPGAILVELHGMRLFVHGIRVVDNFENTAIEGSGKISFPDTPPVRRAPASYPHLAGRYARFDGHPGVFDTREEFQDIARRANSTATFTSKQFSTIAKRVGWDLAAHVEWQATYSGCDIEIYLRGFSCEQKPAYGNDRFDEELRVGDEGAAIYAALIDASAAPPAGAPSATDAAAFAKRILLAWADHGFCDETGAFRRTEEKYYDLDPTDKPHVTQFGTAVIYTVYAQDLLQGIGGLTRRAVPARHFSQEHLRCDSLHA